MYLPPRRTWLARRFARIILRYASGYDVIHYHGHVPNVARFIPEHVNFVQTRHDHGSECLALTRFRDGKVCESVDPADCAKCRTPHPNALQRTISKAAVIQFRREVAESFHCHKTIFVSDMLMRNFSRVLGPGPWGITVHHFVDGIYLKKLRDSVQPAKSTEFHVFTAAKLYPAKGVDLFLRELAPQLRSDMRVTVAGDGPLEARLRSEFESDRIRFLGWCTPEKTLEHAAAANAIVVPSIWEEPFGSTTLEGLLLGKPTFALARGATPEQAIYAAEPEQLRLHPDMQSLVTDLVTFDRRKRFGPAPEELGGVDHAVRRILQIYASPPRHSFC